MKLTNLCPILNIIDTSTSLWAAIIASIMIGMISNLFRMTSVLACQELESVGAGFAGIIGNILHAEYIAMSALFAFAFFGENLAPVEIVGALIIGGAVVGVTVVKAVKQKCLTKGEVGDGGAGSAGGGGGEEVGLISN